MSDALRLLLARHLMCAPLDHGLTVGDGLARYFADDAGREDRARIFADLGRVGVRPIRRKATRPGTSRGSLDGPQPFEEIQPRGSEKDGVWLDFFRGALAIVIRSETSSMTIDPRQLVM